MYTIVILINPTVWFIFLKYSRQTEGILKIKVFLEANEYTQLQQDTRLDGHNWPLLYHGPDIKLLKGYIRF